MTYEAWCNLSEEEQVAVPDSELPEVPKHLLRNDIQRSRAVRKDGVLGWESTQKYLNTEETGWFPEHRSRTVTVRNFTAVIHSKFNPLNGMYEQQISGVEPSLEEEPIGIYGTRWMQFMEEQYPAKVEWMRFQHRYLTVARSVDKAAMAYQEMLEKQYTAKNPRPQQSFEEILAWEQEMRFYIEHQVMEDKVLVPITEAE